MSGAFDPHDEFELEPEDGLPEALRAIADGLPDGSDEPESTADRAKRYHRYTKEEKVALFDTILELKSREKLAWDEIAAKIGVARSTILDWRRTDEWRMAEARWRRIMREETRSDVTEMGNEALGVLNDLMHNSSSAFVRYSSAAKVLDLVGVGDEIEEQKLDQAAELNKFLQEQDRRRERRERMAREAGVGHGQDLLALEVKPGGMLPDAITRLNEALVQERMHQQEAIEAEFRALDDEAATAPPASPPREDE